MIFFFKTRFYMDSVHKLLRKQVCLVEDAEAVDTEGRVEEEEEVNFIGETGFQGSGNEGGNRNSYGNRGNFNQSSQYQKPYSNNMSYGNPYYQKPLPSTQERKIEEMLDTVLEAQQPMTVDFNGKIDSVYTNLNTKLETLSTHMMKLEMQVVRKREAVKRQEALTRGVEDYVMKQLVNAIIGDDFWQVVNEEKLQDGDFEVESLMSFGGSHWCRSMPDHAHRSTSPSPNRSTGSPKHQPMTPTESTATCNAVRILTHEEFAAKHPHPLNPDNVGIARRDVTPIDRQKDVDIDRQPPASIDRRAPITYRVQMPKIDVARLNALRPKPTPSENPPETVGIHSDDGEDSMEVDRVPMGRTLRKRKEKKEKHLKRGAIDKENKSFRKRVFTIPLDKPFEEAYYTQRLWMFFRATREKEEDLKRMFCEDREKMGKRVTLKKKSAHGQIEIPCTVKGIECPHALCDIGASVSILPRVMADHLGLQVEPSNELFTFVDCSQRNSGGIVRDLEVQIGNALVPVDFYVQDIKLNWNSSLLLGRAFLSTVGAVCNLQSNQLCLTLIDPQTHYDPIPVKKTQMSSRRINDP
ncbi:hypothetical protein YC2023_074888 [Brassica napus]